MKDKITGKLTSRRTEEGIVLGLLSNDKKSFRPLADGESLTVFGAAAEELVWKGKVALAPDHRDPVPHELPKDVFWGPRKPASTETAYLFEVAAIGYTAELTPA